MSEAYSDKEIVDRFEEMIEQARHWGGNVTNTKIVQKMGELLKHRKKRK